MRVYLADSSVGQYRRGDGQVSLRLRSYLMIETEVGFRLSRYLRDISGRLVLPSGRSVPFQEITYSENCLYRSGVMMHDFWAGGVTSLEEIRDDVAWMRLDYRISFTGSSVEEPESWESHVPLLARGPVELRSRSVSR